MNDYQKMYAILCGAASDALDLLPQTAENAPARIKLEQALHQAEEVYLKEENDAE